jgi:hypothetical protein
MNESPYVLGPRDNTRDPAIPDLPDPVPTPQTIIPPPVPAEVVDCKENPYATLCLLDDPEAIHASSSSADAVQVMGEGNVFTLPVASGGGIVLKGNNNRLDGSVSSAATPVVVGNNNVLGTRGSGTPNFLPLPNELVSLPRSVPSVKWYSPQDCPSGSLQLNASSITTTVFSECELTITGNNVVVNATIASSKPIRVIGDELTFKPTVRDDAFLIVTSNPNALTVSGHSISVGGRIRVNTAVIIRGNNANFCRVEALTFAVIGNNATAASCAPQ